MLITKNTATKIFNLINQLQIIRKNITYHQTNFSYSQAKNYHTQSIYQRLVQILTIYSNIKPKLLTYLNITDSTKSNYFNLNDFEQLDQFIKQLPKIKSQPKDIRERLAFTYLADTEQILSQTYHTATTNLINLLINEHPKNKTVYSGNDLTKILNHEAALTN